MHTHPQVHMGVHTPICRAETHTHAQPHTHVRAQTHGHAQAVLRTCIPSLGPEGRGRDLGAGVPSPSDPCCRRPLQHVRGTRKSLLPGTQLPYLKSGATVFPR